MRTILIASVLFLWLNAFNSCNYRDALINERHSSYEEMFNKNRDYFISVERRDYASMPAELQNIILENISNEKKYKIWIEKLNQVLNSNFYKGKKRDFIEELIENLNPNIFTQNTEENKRFTSFFFSRVKEYQFSDLEVFLLGYTLHDIDSEGNITSYNQNRYHSLQVMDDDEGGGTPDCHIFSCYIPIACGGGPCTTNCETVYKCGITGDWSCDGYCE